MELFSLVYFILSQLQSYNNILNYDVLTYYKKYYDLNKLVRKIILNLHVGYSSKVSKIL